MSAKTDSIHSHSDPQKLRERNRRKQANGARNRAEVASQQSGNAGASGKYNRSITTNRTGRGQPAG